jgi:GSH-dependent disulfide-bond oxidoreductase
MIDLYTAATPNGRKAVIMLEELGLPYTLHALDLRAEDQRKPEYLAINPNGRIPAIVDHEAAGIDGGKLAVFESGAILIYLAEKTGKLLAPSGQARYEALEWVMFQMSAVGPMFGQFFHFNNASLEKVPYAIERYRKESLRIMAVLEGRLTGHEYLAGEYSIADVCTYAWVAGIVDRLEGTAGLVHVRAWLARVGARPAVEKAMKIP